MSHAAFFATMETYAPLTARIREEWGALLQKKTYRKGSAFVSEGDVPQKAAFVLKGLFSQSYTAVDGSMVIKYFFPEGRIAASVSATLLGKPSPFTIGALENSTVLEYSFTSFRTLVGHYPELALFYIRYLERHWIVEKEPEEISLRHDIAASRYADFAERNPQLLKRLKQHHIAAWLGISPESLSRLKKDRTIAHLRAP